MRSFMFLLVLMMAPAAAAYDFQAVDGVLVKACCSRGMACNMYKSAAIAAAAGYDSVTLRVRGRNRVYPIKHTWTTQPVSQTAKAPMVRVPKFKEVQVRHCDGRTCWYETKLVQDGFEWVRQSPAATKKEPAKPTVAKAEPQKKTKDLTTDFAPSPEEAAVYAIRFAGIEPGSVVYDLGCGDGRVLVAAVAAGAERCIGVELNPETASKARQRTKAFDEVSIIEGDLFETDVSDADVVFVYLYPQMLAELMPRLRSMLKPGARVVSYNHDLPGGCTFQHSVGDHDYFVWTVASPEPVKFGAIAQSNWPFNLESK